MGKLIPWCKTHDCEVKVRGFELICPKAPKKILEGEPLPAPCDIRYREVA
jgi:hypothetical protein